MAISREDVIHVAKLAKLELTEDEIQRLVRDLGGILEHVAELSRLDTTGVPPTSYLAVNEAPFRPDVVEPSVPVDVALAQAARHGDGGFAVPGFVDET